MRLTHISTIASLLFASATELSSGSGERLSVEMTSLVRTYCHIVQLPWKRPYFRRPEQVLMFNDGDYEIRVLGVLGTRFLVAKFLPRYNETRTYSLNKLEVDFSDPSAKITEVSNGTWEEAAVVPLYRKSVLITAGPPPKDLRLDYGGFPFEKTGFFWTATYSEATRISPDRSWLVLQSSTGKYTDRRHKVFWDVFDTASGKKLITIEGSYWGLGYNPAERLARTAWVTERYFVVQLGEYMQKCLVCEFSKKQGVNK